MGCYQSQGIKEDIRETKDESNYNDLTHKKIDLNYSMPDTKTHGLHTRFQTRSKRKVIL